MRQEDNRGVFSLHNSWKRTDSRTARWLRGTRNAAWHAWLELDGLIVDLAPDQFNEIPQLRAMPELYEDAPQGFIVTEASKSPWHSRMEQYSREPASAKLSSRSDLEAVFSAIMANLL